MVQDLNRLYQTTPALYELDFEPQGFQWIDCTDNKQSVIAFLRRAEQSNDWVLVICNFTPVLRENYRIGVSTEGVYRELFNSDGLEYGGSGVGNLGTVTTETISTHGHPHSLNLTLPPLAVLVLQPEQLVRGISS